MHKGPTIATQQGRLKQVIAVTGIESPWGPTLLRELLQAGETVVALIRCRRTAAAFASENRRGCFHVVWGREDNPARIHSLLAIHEVTQIYHLDRISTSLVSSLTWALRRYCRDVPVITLQKSTTVEAARQLLQSYPFRYGIVEIDELFGPGIGMPESVDAHRQQEEAGHPLPELAVGEMDHGNESKRDYVYVRDAALALRMVAQEVIRRRQSTTVPFRSGWRFTSTEWQVLQERARSGELCLSTVMTPVHPLGWQPQQSLAEALRASYGSDAVSATTSGASHSPSAQRRAA